jgi:hypothetical protein
MLSLMAFAYSHDGGVVGVQSVSSGVDVVHEPLAGVCASQSGVAGLVEVHVVVAGVCGVHSGGSVNGKNRNSIKPFSKV